MNDYIDVSGPVSVEGRFRFTLLPDGAVEQRFQTDDGDVFVSTLTAEDANLSRALFGDRTVQLPEGVG